MNTLPPPAQLTALTSPDPAAADVLAAIKLAAHTICGTICGMQHKTTVYLPDELKVGLTTEARRRGCSEAEVIRSAIATAVRRPRPTAGIVAGEPFADRVDDCLAGFGEG